MDSKNDSGIGSLGLEPRRMNQLRDVDLRAIAVSIWDVIPAMGEIFRGQNKVNEPLCSAGMRSLGKGRDGAAGTARLNVT